jgi:hypothetical protein
VIVFDTGELGQITVKKATVVDRLDPAIVAAAFQAHAQAPGPIPAPTLNTSTFQEGGKVVWSRVVTLGGNYSSSSYKQGVIDPAFPDATGEALKLPGSNYVLQGQATIVRSASRGISFLDASYNYVVFEPAGKQADVPRVSVGYNFKVGDGKKFYGVSRYSWSKDKIRQVDYSNQAIFGLGIHTVDTPRIKLDLIPGGTVIREKKGTRFDGKWEGGFGFLEQLTLNVSQAAQIEQRTNYYQLFADSSYRALETYVGYKAMLSKQLGVQFGLNHLYDSAIAQRATKVAPDTLFPGQPALSVFVNNKTQVLMTFGVMARF